MQDILTAASTVLAVVAIGIAIWQGVLSRSQLRLAQETRGETEEALSQIKRLTEDNKRIADALKSDFDTKIARIFDHWISETERKSQAAHDDDRQAADTASKVMGFLGSEFKKAVEEGKQRAADEAAQAELKDGQEGPAH